MATADHITAGPADEQAWRVFFDALDPDSAIAASVPDGAAVVAADAPNLDELKRRYGAEGRPVVLVDAHGRVTAPKSGSVDVGWLAVLGGALLFVWHRLRSAARIPA